eukprot:TRINITY_DN802_c0_g1_i1.p1 TRINITY_DN802_c0_g1~~TRINITY_DN802_c0_g1_i1.p1  ORF type:complete len:556 (+),score=108.41 TRINITY_DN802_c0_g1_i1:62-1729(+)
MVDKANDEYLKQHSVPYVVNEMIELCLLRKGPTPLKDMSEFLAMKSIVYEGRPNSMTTMPAHVLTYNPILAPRRTGVVCTVGRYTDEAFLSQLIEGGMTIMRINCSHGTHDQYRVPLRNVRAAMKKAGKYIGLMLDTKGPEIRTGTLEGGKDVTIEEGSTVRLQMTPAPDLASRPGNKSLLHLDYLNMPKVLKVGDTVLVDDGLLGLTVKEIGPDFIVTQAQNTATIGERKGVNLPNVAVDLPAVSEKDKDDLLFAVEEGMDYIAASFIRKAEHVREIREVLGPKGARLRIISKIENQEGLDNFDEILQESDGIMVARGDMGTEIAPQKVFLAQKMIIRKCNIAGKPVITATQMLESMHTNPRPTRAEAADVANAVLDGSDCVMLSGETAKGKYPQQAVRMMSVICQEAEAVIDYRHVYDQLVDWTWDQPSTTTETIASAAVKIAIEQRVKLIIIISETGDTARMVSKYRPPCHIMTVVFDEQAARLSQMSRGLLPYVFDPSVRRLATHEIIKEAIKAAKEKRWVQYGDFVVAVHDQDASDGHETANYLRTLIVD